MTTSNEEQKEINELKKARDRFINEIANNIHLYDITQSVGRLYGTVFFSDDPMTLDEMSDELGMSKTSMSTGIRSLLDANMVERVWEKGIRKDLYKAEDDWYKSFSNVFITRWRSATEKNRVAIQDTKDLLKTLYRKSNMEKTKTLINADLKKLNGAEAYYDWLDDVITLFESGNIYNIIPKKEPQE